ncbi:MAG: hypothetical protein JRD89_00285 [Deltaproteobacteria bacterium]|nr:hypothetical protein [Deltaproteobacteria bacterium]
MQQPFVPEIGQLLFAGNRIGPCEVPDFVKSGLYQISSALIARFSENPQDEMPAYGWPFMNNTFMMRNYCWCERGDCPWCSGGKCTCPPSAFIVEKNGVRKTAEEVEKEILAQIGEEPPLFLEKNPETPEPGMRVFEVAPNPEYDRWRREYERLIEGWQVVEHHPVCPSCRPPRWWADVGAVGCAAPNFWYKPTDLKIWWYKYIGRSMSSNRGITSDEWQQVVLHVLRSLEDDPVDQLEPLLRKLYEAD